MAGKASVDETSCGDLYLCAFLKPLETLAGCKSVAGWGSASSGSPVAYVLSNVTCPKLWAAWFAAVYFDFAVIAYLSFFC